jgi:hypothetical protein
MSIINTLTKLAGRTGLVLMKHSPEILLGAGITGVITGTVLACRATLKVEQVLDELDSKKSDIEGAKRGIDSSIYSPEDYKKDMMIANIQAGFKIAKLYLPPVLITGGAIACFVGSHNILNKRNLAIVAAFKAVEQNFKDYRSRVVEEYGKDKDREFRYGVRKTGEIEVTEIDENGELKTVKVKAEVSDPNHHSIYARYFDESSREWSKTPEYNLVFLIHQQNYFNDRLKAVGHVFLNEVYDALGLERTQAGAVVGWVLGENNDNYIDFGIHELNRENSRNFVNGLERSILLDFNVDGTIFDKI